MLNHTYLSPPSGGQSHSACSDTLTQSIPRIEYLEKWLIAANPQTEFMPRTNVVKGKVNANELRIPYIA